MTRDEIGTINIKEWETAMQNQRRERIATAALQGVLANSQWLPPDTTWEQIAVYSIRAADALIAELDKPKEQPK